MFSIGKVLLGVILGAFFTLAPACCVTVNKSPGSTETKVGGNKGVVVEHEEGAGTDVTVGGKKGIDVQHREGD